MSYTIVRKTHALGYIMYGLRHWYLWNAHHLPKCIICHKAIVMITGRTHCFHNNMLRRKPWPISSFALTYVTDICTMAKLKKPGKKKNSTKVPTTPFLLVLLGTVSIPLSYSVQEKHWKCIIKSTMHLPPVQLETPTPPPLPFGKTYLLKDFPQWLNSF